MTDDADQLSLEDLELLYGPEPEFTEMEELVETKPTPVEGYAEACHVSANAERAWRRAETIGTEYKRLIKITSAILKSGEEHSVLSRDLARGQQQDT